MVPAGADLHDMIRRPIHDGDDFDLSEQVPERTETD